MTPPGLGLRGTARIGGTVIFGPLELAVPAGAWTCVLGPSGVGKSTLLRLVAGIADGVALDGTVAASDGAPLAGRVALMAQTDPLLPWLTALENVALGDRVRGAPARLDRAAELLGRVGLAGRAAAKPAALSGGQRQRVALARTLFEDRPVVLLDEPFSALDVRTRAQMQDLAAAHLAGRTVLHITHDPAEAARLATQTYVMTGVGLTAAAAPPAAAPRAPDDPDTLAATGRLTRMLLDAA